MLLQQKEPGDMKFLAAIFAPKLETAHIDVVEHERDALRRQRDEARRAAFRAQGEALDALAQSFLDDIRRPNKG
jgi:hypothetical protein